MPTPRFDPIATKAVDSLLEGYAENTELVFPHNDMIPMREHGSFLIDFSRLYSRVFSYLRTSELRVTAQNAPRIADDFFEKFEDEFWWSNVARSDVGAALRQHHHYSLRITRISYNSPLEMALYGSAAAVLIAVIVAGGKIQLPGLKLELNPIGDGIKRIREALSRTSSRRPPAKKLAAAGSKKPPQKIVKK